MEVYTNDQPNKLLVITILILFVTYCLVTPVNHVKELASVSFQQNICQKASWFVSLENATFEVSQKIRICMTQQNYIWMNNDVTDHVCILVYLLRDIYYTSDIILYIYMEKMYFIERFIILKLGLH